MPKLKIKDSGSWQQPTNVHYKDAGSWQSVRRIWRKEAGNWLLHWPTDIPVEWDTSGSTVQTLSRVTAYRAQNSGFSAYVDTVIPPSERSLYAAHVVGMQGSVNLYYSDDDDDSTWGGYIRIGLGLTYSRQLVDPARAPGVMSLGGLTLQGPTAVSNVADSGFLTVNAPTSVGSPAGSPAETFQDEVVVGARFRVSMTKPGGDDDNLQNYNYSYTVYLYTAPVLVDGTPWKLDVTGEPTTTITRNNSTACVGHDEGATPSTTTITNIGPQVGDSSTHDKVATSFAPRWRRTCSGCDDDSIGCVRQYIYLRGNYKAAALTP